MSDDQLETFQLEGLINSYIPHHHLVALSASELLWHKLIDALHDGNLLSLAFLSPLPHHRAVQGHQGKHSAERSVSLL